MPRIRSIKPEITCDRKFASVSRDARLTFVYCLTIADDEGLFRAEDRQLLGALFPNDSGVTPETLRGWLEELVAIRALRWRTTKDGSCVGEIVNWGKHQKISHPSASFIAQQLQPLTRSSRRALRRDSGTPLESLASGSGPESRVLSPESRSSARVPRVTWLTPYHNAWAAVYGGKPNGGQMAKALKPLHDEHGLDKTLAHFRNYLASTEAPYASPAKFAATFGAWERPREDRQRDPRDARPGESPDEYLRRITGGARRG